MRRRRWRWREESSGGVLATVMARRRERASRPLELLETDKVDGQGRPGLGDSARVCEPRKSDQVAVVAVASVGRERCEDGECVVGGCLRSTLS